MFERTHITNLLLLTILAGILLVSGSLQCAFNCLTRLDSSYQPTVRVDDCHFVDSQPDPVVAYANKASHQGGSHNRNFGVPEYHNQMQQKHPLASTSQPVTPDCKTGESLEQTHTSQHPLLAFHSTRSLAPFQSLREIRTTVLLN